MVKCLIMCRRVALVSAACLREALGRVGVTRSKLFEQSEERLRFRAHDLRSTFVTLALANGRTDDWVRQRTGHMSFEMLAHYRQAAETVKELDLGWLKPLHEVRLVALPYAVAPAHIRVKASQS